MTLYFFHGQEEFLMEKEIEKLKKKLLDKSFISMSFKKFSNPKFNDLLDILSTQPMMFGNSLILIDCEAYFESKSETTFDDKQLSRLESALNSVSPQINIVFLYKIDRNINKKIDTRKKLYKILSKYCTISEYKQLPTYDKNLPATIIKLGKENGIELNPKSATKIIEMLGSNMRIIDNEIKKLKLYIYPQNTPSAQDIENICCFSQDVFKLIDYFVSVNKALAMKEFKLLAQTQHPLQILVLLQNTVSRFITLKLLSRKMGTFEISKKINMHEYRVKLELEKIRNYKYIDLLQLKQNLLNCEFKIKSGQTASEELAVEQILLGKAE